MKAEDIEHRPVIIFKGTYDLLLKQDEPLGLIALYNFYYYTAVWQKTNQPKATTSYAAYGLKISKTRIRRYKAKLMALGLIEEVVERSEDNSRIKYHFIKVKYYVGNPTRFLKGRKSKRVEKDKGNAYNAVKRNTYSDNKKTMPDETGHRDLLGNTIKKTFDERMSNKLEHTVRHHKKLHWKGANKKNWIKCFENLRIKGRHKKQEIKLVLNWYCKHFGEKYVTQSYAASSFADDFARIESAMKRYQEQIEKGEQPITCRKIKRKKK